MEIYLDRAKTLKFQLSSPDMSDEAKNNLQGNLLIHLEGLSLTFKASINKDWVATVEVPRLMDLLKAVKEGTVEASFCLHDEEYFFKVWEDEIELVKGRPDLKAKVIEDDEKTSNKKKKDKSKAVVEAVIVEEELIEESEEEPKVETTKPEAIPAFQRPEGGVGTKTTSSGLRSYLDRLNK